MWQSRLVGFDLRCQAQDARFRKPPKRGLLQRRVAVQNRRSRGPLPTPVRIGTMIFRTLPAEVSGAIIARIHIDMVGLVVRAVGRQWMVEERYDA